MPLYFIGVSKEFINKKSRRANPYKGKKRKMAHYYDEIGNHVKKKEGFISFYFKKFFFIKWKRRKFICPECGNFFEGLVTVFRKDVDCPDCL